MFFFNILASGPSNSLTQGFVVRIYSLILQRLSSCGSETGFLIYIDRAKFGRVLNDQYHLETGLIVKA